jgi:hypothetical protein
MADSRAFEAFWVFEAALVVGRHWNDQDGVNADRIDDLANAVRLYDERSPGETTEPLSVKQARDVLRLWSREGVCPTITKAAHACPWTCGDCQQLVPPTRESDGEKLRVRCRLAP